MKSTLEQYLTAAMPRPPKIFGVQLRPYSIGHAMLLQQWESRSVLAGAKISSCSGADLLLGLLICSRSYEAALARLRNRRTAWLVRLWSWQLRVMSRERVLDGIVNFGCYVVDGSQFPEFWTKGKKRTKPPGAPWLQSLKLGMMVHFHKTESEALNTPVCLAQWDFCAYLESQDQIEIGTDEDREAIQEAKAEIAALQATLTANTGSGSVLRVTQENNGGKENSPGERKDQPKQPADENKMPGPHKNEGNSQGEGGQ